MIVAKSLEELESKLEKARIKALAVNPLIEIVELGHYRVEGSKGNVYDCYAGRNADGEFFIGCTCRGGLERNGCYHAWKVFYTHKAEMEKVKGIARREAEKDAPYLKKTPEKKAERVGNIRI